MVAPPYDVISPAAARRPDPPQRPYYVVRLELPDSPARGRDLLHDWRREGALVRDDAAGAVVARAALHRPGRRRPHARAGSSRPCACRPTRRAASARTSTPMRDAKRERLELMRATHRTSRRSSALYDDPEGGRVPRWRSSRPARRRWRRPTATAPCTASGRSRPAQMAAVQEALADREILIADGHHRYETALAYREEQRAARRRPRGRPPLRLRADVPRQPARRGARDLPDPPRGDRQRDVDPRLPAAFSIRELPAGTPAAVVEAELNEIPAARSRSPSGAARRPGA